MSIIQGTSKSAAGGSDPFVTTLIPNSIWLDGAADFLERQNGSAFSNRKEVIISFWVQRNKFATKQAFFAGVESSAGFFLTFDVTTDKLFLSDGGSKNTTAVYRDIGWYHLLISYDTSQVVATDRTQLYVNGVQVTSFSTAGTVGLNSNIAGISGAMTGAENMRIGAYNNTEVNLFFFNGYIAQACMLESVSLQQGDFAVSDFLDTFTYGTNGSQFVPKANADIATLASTAGGNSFCLDFADSSDLGNDISSNNNDFSPTSMAAVNQSGNTPSLVYPVFNPLAQVGTGTGTLSEGNTKVVLAADNGITATQTIPSTGLWYWEMDWTAGANGIYPGVCVQSAVGNTASSPHARTDTWIWLAGDSQGRVFNGSSLDAYVGSATAVGKIAVCFDADNTAMYFGTISTTTITWLDSGDPTSGSSKTGAAPFTSLPTDETVYIFQSTGDASTVQYLFDEDDWTGATNRPAAALALSSANLPTPEFQGADFFNTNLYTGNGTAIGSGGKAVTGVGFKPDWSWIKNRDATDSHSFYDLVRGTTKQIESDNTAVQTTEAEGLTTFGTDGFTVGNLAQVNTNTEDYVSWNWLANNATESISASGANPTLASTNTASDSGAFGMCTYTGNATAGSTVKHSLGGVPDMIMFKRFGSTTANWLVYFKELGAGNLDYLILDLKLAEGGAGAVAWLNSTAATSTLVTLGNDGNVNASDTYIMYLFRNVPGVCKVGSYTGNGNNNGPYVSVGFLPRYILVRSTSANRNWNTLDTARNPINITSPSVLLPNSTAVDTAGQVGAFDILADGFKPRDTAANTNGSGEKYTYLAMADIGGNGTLPPIYAR